MNKTLFKSAPLFTFFMSATLVIFSTTAAHAVLPPTSTEPGAVIKSLEQKDRPNSHLDDIVNVPKMDEKAAGVSTKKMFELHEVVLDHAAAYKSQEFKSIYAPYIGQKVSFADLNAIAFAMTRKYREDGYIFSRVIVPPQKINGGVVHFQAIEGKISNVKVVGNFKDKNGLVQKLADRIRAAGPANTREIERYLLLIDDLPGLTARSFIKPSQTPGAGDLIISVDEDDFEGSVSVDDRGSKYLGPYRGEGVAAFNDVFGLHDRTTLRALTATQTSEIKYGEVTHEEQLGSDGARLTTRFALTDSAPGGNVKALDIDGKSSLLDVTAMYPLVRGRQMNVNLQGGLTVLESNTTFSGIKTGADRVRYAHANAHVDFTDSLRGVNQIDVQLAQGIDGLGATEEGTGRSRANGSQDFFRSDVTLTRVQDLPVPDVSLYLSGTAQGTTDSLLASEEFSVGGGSYGRAYDSGEIAGDRGYAGIAELRYGHPVDSQFLKSYQAYTFIDGGRVFNLNPVVGEVHNDSLVSTGVGVRFNLDHDVSGYLEVDSPLTQQVRSEGTKKTRVFFNLLKRF